MVTEPRMLQLIQSPVDRPDPALTQVDVCVDRQKLAKRIWRGKAVDGVEFGFELEKPLQPGDAVFQTSQARYVIVQEPEPVLEISLAIATSAAAGIGWAIGNMHLELMAERERLLTPDDKATRQLLERIRVPYTETKAVFRPGRFARGDASEKIKTDELGPSHKH